MHFGKRLASVCSRAPFRACTVITSLALGQGCNWNKFEDIADGASIRVYDAPAEYRKSNYGAVLTTLKTDEGKPTEASRLIVSAGADSPVVFETVWASDDFSGASSTRCKKKEQCAKGVGIGAALIPFPLWGAATPQPQRGCVLTPGLPNAYVFCETNTSASNNYELKLQDIYAPGDKSTVHFSGAGLPEKYPLGVALLGVHVVRNLDRMPERGTLFFQPDLMGTSEGNVPYNQRLDFVDPRTKDKFSNGVEAGDYAYAVAAQVIDGQKLLIAVAQPSKKRVIVGEYDPSIEIPDSLSGESPSVQQSFRAHTLACVKAPDESLVGFGKVLTLGDIDDDGQPELLVGIDPNDSANGGKQRVYMYPGTGLPAYDADADVCPLWGEAPVQVGCHGGVRGVACENTGFGTALAVGDVDGDMFGDLIAGAPHAEVQGVKGAGVVWVIPGSETGLDFDRMTNLYVSGQEKDGLMGSTVGAVRTRGRDEPVAGAPGSDLVYMFLCSKLEAEKPTTQCLPKK
jgi:hypothetical protein